MNNGHSYFLDEQYELMSVNPMQVTQTGWHSGTLSPAKRWLHFDLNHTPEMTVSANALQFLKSERLTPLVTIIII